MLKNIIFAVYVLLFSFPVLAQEGQCACCSDIHRQFDFWAGEWIVYITGTDTIAGRNTIEIDQDGCMLRESWTSEVSSFNGSSVNFYEPSSRKWNQVWIDNSGLILRISGERSGDRMVMESEPTFYSRLDRTVIDRISWVDQDDGTVRQVWERRDADGLEWLTVFDGTYVKKEEAEDR